MVNSYYVDIFGNIYKSITALAPSFVYTYIYFYLCMYKQNSLLAVFHQKLDGFAAILTDDALNLWLTFLLLNYETIYTIQKHISIYFSKSTQNIP